MGWLGAGPSTAQPVLTDSLYLAHHPRLLFAAPDIPGLRVKLQNGGRDDEAYDFLRNVVENFYATAPPNTVLGPFFGLEAMPAIGLVAHLDVPPHAAAMAHGKLLTTFLAQTYAPDFNEANSGMRLRSLALGYDWFFADATESERAVIRDEMVEYMELMTTSNAYEGFEYRPYLANHSAMFGAALGLAAICLQGEADASLLSDAMAMADRIVANLLAYQFDPGGAYNEGGLYALWTLRNLVYYFDARKRFDGYAYGDHATVRAVEQWLPYELLHEGGGRSHNLNDSPYGTIPFARSGTYFDWAMTEWNSGLSAWLWDRTSGTYGVDFGVEADKAATALWHRTLPLIQPNAVLPRHRIWLQRGLYHFRTGWQSGNSSKEDVAFSFYSGKFQGGHAQEDQNQFALYAYGAKFVIDHGAGGMGKESTAHNMVLIDGQGQHNAGSSIGTDGRIAQYLLGGSADYVVGDATQAYTTYSEFNAQGVPFPGSDWSWGHFGANPVQFAYRRILVVHGSAAPPYFVVMDDIGKDNANHTYEWRMHTHSDNTVNTAASPWTIGDGSATMDIHPLPTASSLSVTTQPFDNFNEDPDSRVLRVTRSAINPRFAFLLIPREATVSSPAVTSQTYAWGYACSIDWGGGVVDYLVRNDSGATAAHGPVQTDALVAWVRQVGGGVESYLAADASALVVGATEFVAIQDGVITCEMSGSTISVDRDDADFRFFDSGIAKIEYREQSIGFVHAGGFLVPLGGVTTVDPSAPRRLFTISAHPNPFNPNTTIRIDGVAGQRVSVDIYDVSGRRVRRVWDAPTQADPHVVVWDGRDDAGQPVASGTYFLRASTIAGSRTLKLTPLK